MKLKKTLGLALLALGMVGVAACDKEEASSNDPVDTGEGETGGGETGGGNTGGGNTGGGNTGGGNTGGGNTGGGSTGGGSTGGGTTDSLATAKQTAKTELGTYASTKVNGVTATDKTALVASVQAAKAAGDTAIDAATDQDGIDLALLTAKMNIDTAVENFLNPPANIEDGKINDAKEFLAMLEKDSGTFTIENDIDLSAVEIPAPTKVFSGTIDGQGHKLIFSSSVQLSLAKGSGLFYKKIYDTTIKNLVIENINLTNKGDGGGLFGYGFGDIKFENLTFTNPKAVLPKYGGLLLAKAGAKVELKNIAVTGYDISGGDYSGVLIGLLSTGSNVWTGWTGTDTASGELGREEVVGTLKATNILLDGTFSGGTQSNGGILGQVDNKVANHELEVDGVVLKGTIKGGKNVGGIVGSFKASGTKCTISNVLGLDVNVIANTLDSNNETAKVGLAYGQDNSKAAVLTNVVGIKKATTILADNNNDGLADIDMTPNLPTYVNLADAVAPNSAFTIANGKISLGTQASVDMPVVQADEAVAVGTIADGDEADSATATVNEQTITFAGEVDYFHENAGKIDDAGNAVAVKITAATGVDTTGATYSINGGATVSLTSGEAIYVPVSDLTQTATITVKWNENAVAQEYVVAFENATLEAAPVYGAISNADANTDLVASVEGSTLKYTAGEIAWDATNKGNTVTIKVAKPEWVADPSAVTVTGGTIVGTVAATDTDVTILVKVAAAGSQVKVQWTADTDSKTYSVAIDGATLAANPNASAIKEYKAEDILKAAGIATDDTGKGVAITAGTYEGLVFDEGSKRANSGTLSIEIAKNGGSSIGVTVTGAAAIKVSWSSTGGSNTSDLALYDSTGTMVGTLQSITGTTASDAVFNVTAAGTYYIKSLGGTNTGRGARIYSITTELTA